MGGMKLRLKQLRDMRGLSQRALAEKAGMSPSYYADIERGDKQINARRLDALARALDVEPADIISDEANPEDVKMRAEYEGLPEAQKELVRQMVSSLASKGK